MKAALLPLLLLGACDVSDDRNYLDGRACWAQHRDYTICYTKCAAMNPKERAFAKLCVQGVDDAGSDKGEPKP